MGQSKGSGYQKLDVNTPDVNAELQRLLGIGGQNQQQAAQGYQQFLPGGGGGQPIIQAAQNRFNQQTVPSIMNAFGAGLNSKSGSALNQALAAGASNLNTDLGSQLAGMQMQAAQGLGGMGQQQTGMATQTPQFAYQQKQLPFWQQLVLGGVGAGGQLGGAYMGMPRMPNLGIGQQGQM